MKWQFSADAPIYTQLVAQIQMYIVSGALPPGERLPSVREFAAEAGVNPNTMQRALAHLEDQGLAVGNRTQGRMVTEDEEKLRAVRLALAEELKNTYLDGMAVLGFTRAEACRLLEEGA